ncbi:PDDEXK nuclease domain-containing protein [Ornithinimicrobium murale]|uniref:PDDEXK nuclease domain-containing protein n=1 Tax=Ornithinimicrobium murale TaxID=1050153 RepID=UPI003B514878
MGPGSTSSTSPRRLQVFLLELGHGFAFVGRQLRFEIGGHECYIDLLFFHIPQGRYVVIERKVVRFSA